jgi:hypothetical protein
MPKQVRLRRGTTAQHATFIGADGEVTFDTSKKALVLHDGVTPGGKPLDGFVVLAPGNPLVTQELQGCLAINGGDDDVTALSVPNGAVFGSVYVNNVATVRRLIIQQEAVPYAGNTVLNFGSFGTKRIALAGNVAFSAVGMGFGVSLVLRIVCDGTARTLTWPAGWKFVGSAAPTSIAANKTALLRLWCFGTTDNDVVAQYLVEP